jgi:hypothetical protein
MPNSSLPIDSQGFELFCWSDIKPNTKYEEKCSFYDGSKGMPDPPFLYVAIGPDSETGYNEDVLVCYFDVHGTWITQSPFESINKAIDHCSYLFKIQDYEWYWIAPNTPEKLGLVL